MERTIRVLGAAAVTLLAGALMNLSTMPVAGQDSTGPDALMASLLQPEDLPAGFQTLGPEEGSQFDIDSGAFSRFGGRRVVSQVWSSETSGVVFDFRMELPSPEAAADYLEAAETTLSEADTTGLTISTDDPPVGEDARHYAGVTQIDAEQAITFDNHLFRIGPVVAKVFVGSVDLPPGEGRRLAERAAARMAPFAAAEIGPGTLVAPSAEPSPLLPGASPTATPGATSDAAGRLAALVPEALAEGCQPFELGTASEVAALTCTDDEDLVVFSALADADALDAAFATVTAEMPQDDVAGSCEEGPFIGPYPSDGPAVGRVACWEPPGGGLVLFWTDAANVVLGGILTDSDDHAVLDRTWQSATLSERPG